MENEKKTATENKKDIQADKVVTPLDTQAEHNAASPLGTTADTINEIDPHGLNQMDYHRAVTAEGLDTEIAKQEIGKATQTDKATSTETPESMKQAKKAVRLAKMSKLNWRDWVIGIGYFPVQFISVFITMFVVIFAKAAAGGSLTDTPEAMGIEAIAGLFFAGLVCFLFIVISYWPFLVQQAKDFSKHWLRNILIIIATYIVTIAARIIFTMFVSAETAGNQEALETMFASAGLLENVLLFGPTVIFAPVVEEFLCRKIFVGNSFVKNSKVLTVCMVIVSSIIFGLLHFSGFSANALLLLIPYMIMGLSLATAYTITKNIFVAIGGHFLNNFIAVVLLIFFM